MKILVINGANLNMLGVREPKVYGTDTYDDLVEYIQKHCDKIGVEVEFFQSNHEGDLVDKIQAAYDKKEGIVINPGAYTHTSVAILDALKAVSIPTVEVHISDIDEREEFRRVSYISAACFATIKGHGFKGYTEAVDLLVEEYK